MQKIMFNDKYGLTDLVLSGQKTQTRRMISQKLMDKYDELLENYEVASFNVGVSCIIKSKEEFLLERSPYRIGEMVAVAMSYKSIYERVAKTWIYERVTKTWEYAEEYKNKHKGLAGWKNKMVIKPDLMPYTIKITNIRFEKLQDISDKDCLKEGIYEDGDDSSGLYVVPFYDFWGNKGDGFDNPKEAFAALIDKINGKGTWVSNPYMWVYDFELVK